MFNVSCLLETLENIDKSMTDYENMLEDVNVSEYQLEEFKNAIIFTMVPVAIFHLRSYFKHSGTGMYTPDNDLRDLVLFNTKNLIEHFKSLQEVA